MAQVVIIMLHIATGPDGLQLPTHALPEPSRNLSRCSFYSSATVSLSTRCRNTVGGKDRAASAGPRSAQLYLMSHLQPSSGVLLSCVEDEKADGNASNSCRVVAHCSTVLETLPSSTFKSGSRPSIVNFICFITSSADRVSARRWQASNL